MSVVYLGGVAEKIREWVSGFFGALISIIPKLLYFLCTLIFQVLDILQLLVRKVAGLDVVYYSSSSILGDAGTSSEETGDLVLRFIRTIFTGDNAILSNIFWALIILGLIMLIITTFIAVLRSEYAATDAKSASKGKIIGKAFKAIASFAVVPIVCFFGIYLSNIILQALDTITSGTSSSQLGTTYTTETGETSSVANLFQQFDTATDQKTYISYNFFGSNNGDVGVDGSEKTGNSIPTTSTPISGLLFKASAYKSNRIRNNSVFQKHLGEEGVNAGVFGKFGTQYSKAADLLDECYANAYTLKNTATLSSNSDFEDQFLYPFGGRDSFIGNYPPSSFRTFDKNNVQQVWYYYDLWSFNFVICIGGLVVAAKLLIYLCFGLMKRIFELVVLFLIAAPISSLMPLDDGAALKKWREKFTSKVIAAYGPIVGLNLFFVILPFITEINFFNIPFVDAIVNVFFVIVGLTMVKDLCGTISELIGGEDAMKTGEGMASEVGSTLGKIGQVAAFPAGMALKGTKTAISLGKRGINGIKNKVDKHHQKEAENEAALEGLDDNTRKAIETSSSGMKRRALRALRNGMSDEQRAEAREKYNAKRAEAKAANATAKAAKKEDKFQADLAAGKRSAVRKQRKLDATNLRVATMNANGMSSEEWNNLSIEQQENLMNEEKEKREKYDRSLGTNVEEELKLAQDFEGASVFYGNKRKSLEGGRAEIARLEEALAKKKKQAGYSNARIAFGGTANKEGNSENAARKRDAEIAFMEQELAEKKKAYSNIDFDKEIEYAKEMEDTSRGLAESHARKGREAAALRMEGSGANARRAAIDPNLGVNIAKLNEAGGFIKSGQAMLSAKDAMKFGKKISDGFKEGLIDNLSPIFNALGANLAKGFKDSGSFKAIGNRMHGYSGKEEKMADEVKTQKRILSAQDQASKLLGRGGGGGEPSKLKLDDETIKKLSNAIADAIPKK